MAITQRVICPGVQQGNVLLCLGLVTYCSWEDGAEKPLGLATRTMAFTLLNGNKLPPVRRIPGQLYANGSRLLSREQPGQRDMSILSRVMLTTHTAHSGEELPMKLE